MDDRLRAHRLVRGMGRCDITVTRRPSRLQADLLVFELRQGSWNVVVKHPRSGWGATTVARERKALQRLGADERLGPWRPVLPRAVGSGPGLSGTLLQNKLPGVQAEHLIRNNPRNPDRAAAPALRLLADLRGATGRRRPAAEQAGPWCESQLTILRAGIPRYGAGRGAAALEALRHRLDAALADAVLIEGWTHGDYHPGNVLLDGEPLRVTGVFDWGNAHVDGPCEIDAYTFVLALRSTLTGRSLGDLVADTLRTGHPSDADGALLALAGVDPDQDTGNPLALTLLTWLWHVAGNLRKSPRFGHNHWWLADTLVPVLRESCRWAGAAS
ncbi:aminoglycoside phosphotransferase family protein [Streptomyces sp. NBC_01235]|uniref:aminoglycoside phosphotransferase family protein n=1 Tax=Streptomyces sp. NBC_01235 TaxID=2903788 RepID=UPI002E113E12|nr:aminoglycoside phosphotransferase family protein [Streptomyces sp. NBC_01235]